MVEGDLTILQLNCRRSAQVLHLLLNNEEIANKVHILLIQEPFARFENVVSHHRWTPYGRSGTYSEDDIDEEWPRRQPLPRYPRVLTYANNALLRADISEVGPFHPDTQSIHLQMPPSSTIQGITIHNVYNPPQPPIPRSRCGRG